MRQQMYVADLTGTEKETETPAERDLNCDFFKKGFLDCDVCHVCRFFFNGKFNECRTETEKLGKDISYARLSELSYLRLAKYFFLPF